MNMQPNLTLLTALMLTLSSASMAAERKPFLESIPAWVNVVSGSKVVQLTSQPVISVNVHMEQRFASADGRRIAIERQPFGKPPELWVCDLDTNRLYRIGAGKAMTASFSRNAIYYLTPSPEARLMRVNLADLSTREILAIPDDPPPRKLAISHDERWLVAGPFWARDNLFRLDLIELANGKRTTLCELADIPNPHLQFDPGNPDRLLVQVNRGSKFTPSAGLTRLSGHSARRFAWWRFRLAKSRRCTWDCLTLRRFPVIPPGPGGVVVWFSPPRPAWPTDCSPTRASFA